MPATKSQGRKWDFVLDAFFDDSGKESNPNARYVCMAGYLADQSYWAKFVREWHSLLLIHNISEIHMRDLIPLQGEYKELRWDEDKRNVVLVEFIRLIKENRLIGFAVGVDAAAWREMRKKYEAPNVQNFCFARTMRMVVNRLKRAAERDVVGIVFDTDKEFAPARFKLFSDIWSNDADARRYLASITFADRRIYCPLQAADLLAWETRKDLIQRIGGFDSTPRWQELFTALQGVELDYSSELWAEDDLKQKVVPSLKLKGPGR